MFSLFCKNTKSELIGDGTFVCEIPNNFAVEKEETDTLCIFNPKKEREYYRISFISFEPNDENEKSGGEKNVNKDIEEKKLSSKKIGKYTVAVLKEEYIENNSYIIKLWEFGIGNNVIVISVSYPASSSSKDKLKYEKQVEKIIESIRENEKTVDKNQQPEFRDLNQEEINTINQNIESGKAIVKKYAGETSEDITLSELDVAFKKWQENPDEITNDEIIYGFGTLFGEIARKELAMQWQIINDEYGTDFCLVHRKPDKTKTIIFPFSSLSKRIESKESDFFVPIFDVIKNKIIGHQ